MRQDIEQSAEDIANEEASHTLWFVNRTILWAVTCSQNAIVD
jgi:hypothetical protein